MNNPTKGAYGKNQMRQRFAAFFPDKLQNPKKNKKKLEKSIDIKVALTFILTFKLSSRQSKPL